MSKASAGSSRAHLSRFALTGKVLSALRMRLARNRGARQLSALNDFMLRDIGLTRADVLSATFSQVQRHD